MRYFTQTNIPGLEDFHFCVMDFVHEKSTPSGYLHAHKDFWELVVVKSGSGIHVCCHEEKKISSRDVFLIPPGVVHDYVATQPFHVYNVLFCDGFFQKFGDDLAQLPNYQLYFNLSNQATISNIEIMHIDGSSFSELIKLLEETLDEQTNPRPGSHTAVFSNALKIMLMLCRHAESRTGDLPGAVLAISKLLAEMRKNIVSRWDLEKMAKKCGLSVSSFRQQFKALTGQSPVAWLLEVRLKKAAQLLKNSTMSISDVCLECGFTDGNYFSRQFAKYQGVSPREYRKTALSGAQQGAVLTADRHR